MIDRQRRGQLVLGTHVNPLIGDAAWRHPQSPADEVYSFSEYRSLATAADDAGLDFILTPDGPRHEPGVVENGPVRLLDALVLLSVLAGVTRGIGLIPTISTTFNHPFNVARQTLSLQHLTGGRVGWNVVTSTGGAEHYGNAPLPEHDLRYARADEFIQVTRRFWSSWQPGALLRDRQTGRWTDPARIDAFEHQGAHFQLRGPLNLPAPEAGHPVVVQAGASPAGIDLGAKHAELVYALNLPRTEAKAFYDRFKQAVVRHDRAPEEVVIAPAISPVIADTLDEARDIAQARAELVDFDRALSSLEASLGGIDLRRYDLDTPLPAEALPTVEAYNGQKSVIVNLRRTAYEEGKTLRELVLNRRTSAVGELIGTPESVAEVLIEKFEAHEVDGFTFTAPDLPGGHHDILTKLVPVLTERGYFGENPATALRERLRARRNAR